MARQQGMSCRRSANTASAWSSCRAGDASRRACEAVIERAIRYEGQKLLGWRDVPVDNSGLAQAAQGHRAGDPPGLHRPRPRHHG
jgi:glutamate synthase domain-containing protein 1